MKAILLALLLAAPVASADTVDVFDYSTHTQSRFTGCTWSVYLSKASCGARVDIAHPDSAPNVAGYPEVSPELTYGCNFASWKQCAVTEVYGIGPGNVYHRIDCPASGKLPKPAK